MLTKDDLKKIREVMQEETGNLETKLRKVIREEISDSETKVRGEITSLETKMEHRFDAVEKRFDTRFEKLEKQMEQDRRDWSQFFNEAGIFFDQLEKKLKNLRITNESLKISS